MDASGDQHGSAEESVSRVVRPSHLDGSAKRSRELFEHAFRFAALAGLDLEETIALARDFAAKIDERWRQSFVERARAADAENRQRGVESNFEARYARP